MTRQVVVVLDDLIVLVAANMVTDCAARMQASKVFGLADALVECGRIGTLGSGYTIGLGNLEYLA